MGKAVIVTGASTGIGQGIAQAFLEQGDSVVLVSRSLKKLQAAVPAKFYEGKTAFALAKDLSTPQACKECVEEAVALLGGRLDVLVNNAGAGKFGLPIEKITAEDWAFHMNVNLHSVLFTTQAAIPHLAQSQGGAVINMSSIAAQRAFSGASAYCTSKAAVAMLTKASALELAPKRIRVNSIEPATVVTEFHQNAGMSAEAASAYFDASAALHPIGRVGVPRDVAELTLFLADGAKAGWLTGQNIALEGGRLLPTTAGPGLQND